MPLNASQLIVAIFAVLIQFGEHICSLASDLILLLIGCLITRDTFCIESSFNFFSAILNELLKTCFKFFTVLALDIEFNGERGFCNLEFFALALIKNLALRLLSSEAVLCAGHELFNLREGVAIGKLLFLLLLFQTSHIALHIRLDRITLRPCLVSVLPDPV